MVNIQYIFFCCVFEHLFILNCQRVFAGNHSFAQSRVRASDWPVQFVQGLTSPMGMLPPSPRSMERIGNGAGLNYPS